MANENIINNSEEEELREIRISNMMKWTEEDYKVYRQFFREIFGTDQIPYQEEVKKRKEQQRIECLSEEEWKLESYRRYMEFIKKLKAKDDNRKKS